MSQSQQAPLVSVVMPVYNEERFVLQAVTSILSQTFSDFEFIAIDDGSTDCTPELLASVKDPRFRYVLAPHAGFIRTLVRGYEEARGRWIARMDSDDICHPDRLRIQMEFLAAHPECTFVGSAYGFMSPGGHLAAPRKKFEWKYVEPSEITLGGRVFGDPTTIFDRRIAAEVGFFDPEFDNENPLWYRLLARGKGAVLGRVLYYHQWRLGSHSRSNFESNRRAYIEIRRRYDSINATKLPKPNGGTTEKTWVLAHGRSGVAIYMATGDRTAAKELALSLLRRWPGDLVTYRLMMWAFLGIQQLRVWEPRPPKVLVPVDPVHWKAALADA
jgi:glycosyltransferase involved in cell wall biosynthesis